MEQFSFNSALMHFNRTHGPSGFLWKYILGYVIGIGLLLGVMGYVMYSIWSPAIENLHAYSTDPQTLSNAQTEQMLVQHALVLTASIPVFLFFQAIFEAAALRHYMRDEGFSLRIGADELRVFSVYLLWGLFGLIGTIAFMIISTIVSGVILGSAFLMRDSFIAPFAFLPVLLSYLIFIGLFFYFGIRLAPASAITVRDRRIAFFDGFAATKNRFWKMLGAYLVLMVIFYAINFAFNLAIGAAMAGMMLTNAEIFETDDPEAFLSLIFSPAMIVMTVAVAVFYVALQAFTHFAFLGIASKAARTDPTWKGNTKTADLF